MLKRNISYIIILILFCFKAYGQVSVTDSIINSMKALPDTSKLSILKDYALNELHRSLRTGLKYADKRMEIASELNNLKEIAGTWHIYGNLYITAELYDEAKNSYQKALTIYDSLGRAEEKASILHNLGLLYFHKDDSANSIDYFKRSVKIRKESLDNQRVGDELTTLGEIYLAYKNYTSSLSYLLEALEYYKGIKGYERKTDTYAFLFDNYIASGLPGGRRWIDSMKLENKLIGSSVYTARINLRLARVYLQEEKPEMAADYVEQTDFTLLHKAASHKPVNIFIELADLYQRKGNEAEAIRHRLLHHEYINDYADMEIQDLVSAYNIRLSTRTSEEEIAWSHEQNELILQRIRLERVISFIIYLALAVTLIILLILIYNIYGIRKTNKKLEIRRKKLQEAYERSTRYKERTLNTRENKNIFFSIVSLRLSKPFADLSNMLSDINLYVKNNNKDLKLKKMMESLYHEASVIEKGLERILLWSKLQRNKYSLAPEAINLNEFLHKMLPSLLGTTLRKDIRIRFDIDPGIEIRYDRLSLQTIIEILTENSIEYSPPGSDIIIRAIKTKTGCELSLTDFGSGIPEYLQEQIFDMSRVKTNDPRQGDHKMGLGLLIANLMAEKNNSFLSMESREKAGTTFFIHINENND